jgi:hypothetical protein
MIVAKPLLRGVGGDILSGNFGSKADELSAEVYVNGIV